MSQIFTLNMIIDLFRDIADRHLMVNDFGNGPSYNIGASNPMKFPYLWVENQSATTISSVNGMKEKQYTFVLYLMDKINKGDDNFDEIISDTDFILDGIIQEFSQSPFYVQNRISLVGNIVMQPVVEVTDDNVNGWQATLTFKVPIFKTYCDMPILPVTTAVQPECEFLPFKVVNTLGCEFLNITEYPGPTITLPTIDINSTTVQAFSSIVIADETISSISQIDDCSIGVNLLSKFPILLTNGTCLIDTITGSTPGGSVHILPNVEFFDGTSSLGEYAIVKEININSDCGVSGVTSSVDGCELTIDIASCFPIELLSKEGCLIDTIATNPDGSYTLPETNITDDNGSFGPVSIGSTINIVNGTINNITTTNGGCDTNIILDECEDCFPISIKNSDGCELGLIEECPAPCNGTIWRVRVSTGGSVTNLRLFDCDGIEYDVIASLGPGDYEYCSSILPVADVIILPVTITNTGTTCSVYYKYELPDITVTDDDGFTASVPINNLVIQNGVIDAISATDCTTTIRLQNAEFTPITVKNTDDCIFGTISSATSSFILNDINLNDSAGVFATVSVPTLISITGSSIVSATFSDCELIIEVSGGSTASGIMYKRPMWCGQTASYSGTASVDVGAAFLAGAYDYNDIGNINARLDFTSANSFYTLIDNNAFGIKNRFTADDGTPASDALANFTATEFAGANQNWYVIDHLTGLGYYIVKLGMTINWQNAMNAIDAFNSTAFYNDFRAISDGEFNAVVNDNFAYYDTANIFRRSLGPITGLDAQMWLGNTDLIVATTNAFVGRSTGDIQRFAKTSTSAIGVYAVRNHY